VNEGVLCVAECRSAAQIQLHTRRSIANQFACCDFLDTSLFQSIAYSHLTPCNYSSSSSGISVPRHRTLKPLASALRTKRPADEDGASTQSVSFRALLARVFGLSTVTPPQNVSFGVLLVRVFDRSTVLGETTEDVYFPMRMGQRFRDALPITIASEQAHLESQVGQKGIGDSVHYNCPTWEKRRRLLKGQWRYEKRRLTKFLAARVIRGGMTHSIDEQRAFEKHRSEQTSLKERLKREKELAREGDEPLVSDEERERIVEATEFRWRWMIPWANEGLEIERELLEALEAESAVPPHWSAPFVNNFEKVVSTVLYLALYAFVFLIRWRTTARGLFIGISLLSRWCQSQPCIGDIVHDNINGNAESVVMSPRPPSAITTTGRTQNRRHHQKMPAVAQLRRSPRLMAQQDTVPRQSPHVMAQQTVDPKRSPRLMAQQNTDSRRSLAPQSTVPRRSARIAARECATTCCG
jgi:hypothetical protein